MKVLRNRCRSEGELELAFLQAGCSAEGGVKCEHAFGPADAGIVALQPGKPQHKLEVAQSGDLEGECLCVSPMNA